MRTASCSRGQCGIKIFNGDCLKILPTFSQKFNAIIADPPYNKLNRKCHWDNIIPIKEMWDCILPLCYDTTPIILFSCEPYTSELINSQKNLFKYKLYWKKSHPTNFLNSKKQPLRNIEEILVFYKKQCTYNPQKSTGHKPVNSYTKYVHTANKTVCYGTSKQVSGGGNTDRYPTQLLEFSSDKQVLRLHPTQKPLALIEYLVKTYSSENDIILDFCMGSGTTGKACENLNRSFVGIENDISFFELARQRLNMEMKQDDS